MTVSRAARLIATALVSSAILNAPTIAVPAARAEDGAITARETYALPFKTRAEWLVFVRTLPDGDAAARSYAAMFSEADYAGYGGGAATTTSRITYRSDGLAIRGFLVAPKAPGRYPILIYNHGGVMQWGRIVLPEILEFNRLAARGYIVLASAYRGEGGSEGAPDIDGGDVADSLALIKLAETLPNADPSRIGMWGFSRGGSVTYGALARTDRVDAAVILGGPTDLVNSPRRAEFDKFVYPHVIRDYARDKDGALARLSPIRWPERLAPGTPLLLLHGGDDPRVSPADSLRMGAALQKLKRSYRLKIYEGGSHGLFENYADVRQEMDRWLDRYVRDRRPGPPNGLTVLPIEVTEAE